MEETLRESELRFRLMFENMGDAVAVYEVVDKGNDFVFRDFNKAAERIEKVRSEDVIGKSVIKVFPGVKDFGLLDVFQRVWKTGKSEHYPTAFYKDKRIVGWRENYVYKLPSNEIVAVYQDLTERKQMEENLKEYSEHLEKLVDERTRKLRESEEEYRSIVRNIPVMVWTANRNGETSFITPNVEQLLGYSPEEFRADQQRWNNVHADDKERVRQAYSALFTNGTVFDVEYRYQRPGGKLLWLHDRASLVYEKGGVRYTDGVTTDITTRKLIEDELASAREMLEHAVSLNPAVIYIAKPLPDYSDYDATYISKSISSILGFEAEELVGREGAKLWESHIPAEDFQKFRAQMPALWRDGQHAFEYRFLHKDGKYRWIHEEMRVIRDEEGRVRDVVGYWIDVTERKRLEEDLRAARDRLEYVVSSNPAAIQLGKPLPDGSDFIPTYVSQSVGSLLGFEPGELVEHSGSVVWQSRVPPDDLQQYKAQIPLLWRDGHHTFEYRFLHKDGSIRWIHEEDKVIRDSDGQVRDVIGYYTDETERKRLEEELVKTQRLAAIGETTRMVGHDLRNPLQGIAGATGVLRKHLGSNADETTMDMLDVLEKDVEYSNRIITDLLDYSRPLQIIPVETSLKSILKQSLQMVQAPSSVTVEDQTEDLRIKVDPQIQRVFVNLIKNSCEAMPKGGLLRIGSKSSNATIEISFCDTGTGFTEDVVHRLWKGPVTTKAKGLGLGLAISKGIVEAHGGSLLLENGLEQGATVRVRLPSEPRLGGD